MMADECNLFWSEIQKYIAEADADVIPVPGQLELGVAVSMLWCSLFVADLIMAMEELESHDRCRGRSNFRKIRIATISWSRSYAERIWGEFFILVRRILGKLPANFLANFNGEF